MLWELAHKNNYKFDEGVSNDDLFVFSRNQPAPLLK